MSHIAIISASLREGRRSHRLALFLQQAVPGQGGHTTDLIDLKALDLPLLHERYKNLSDPPTALRDLVERFRKADAVIIVSPEYNGSYPAALKNVVDALTEDWNRKPVALATASFGAFGGAQLVTQLLFSLWKIKTWVVPGALQVPKVHEQFNEDGTPTDPPAWVPRVKSMLTELEWAIAAKQHMA